MDFDGLADMNCELLLAVYPVGTSLSQSSTPGAVSALVRNEGRKLVTHADLFRVEDVPAEDASAESTPKVPSAVYLSAGIVIGIVVTCVAVKAAPHVKDKANELKLKLSRKRKATVETADQEADPELAEPQVEVPRSRSRRMYVARRTLQITGCHEGNARVSPR